MLRPVSIALLAGVMLISFAALPAMLPAMLPAATSMNLSGSALAQKVPETNAKNLNTSRSNIYRMGGGGGKKAARSNVNRMGGGGGAKGAARARNLNSSRSNRGGINLNPFMLIVPDPD